MRSHPIVATIAALVLALVPAAGHTHADPPGNGAVRLTVKITSVRFTIAEQRHQVNDAVDAFLRSTLSEPDHGSIGFLSSLGKADLLGDEFENLSDTIWNHSECSPQSGAVSGTLTLELRSNNIPVITSTSPVITFTIGTHIVRWPIISDDTGRPYSEVSVEWVAEGSSTTLQGC